MNWWVRTVHSSDHWTTGTQRLATLFPGDTLLRVHFSWGFFCNASLTADYFALCNNLQVMGLCTTLGDGTETPPNPRVNPDDANPPQERWLYWEARQPQIRTIDSAAELVTFHDSAAQAPVGTKGMVSAKTIVEPTHMHLWASWAAAGDWNETGRTAMWFYASILGTGP